jgi:hypothetical protein
VCDSPPWFSVILSGMVSLGSQVSRDDGSWVVVGWLGYVASVVDSQGALPVEVAHEGREYLGAAGLC